MRTGAHTNSSRGESEDEIVITVIENLSSKVNLSDARQKYLLLKNHFKPPLAYKFLLKLIQQCKKQFQVNYLEDCQWTVYIQALDGAFFIYRALYVYMFPLKYSSKIYQQTI